MRIKCPNQHAHNSSLQNMPRNSNAHNDNTPMMGGMEPADGGATPASRTTSKANRLQWLPYQETIMILALHRLHSRTMSLVPRSTAKLSKALLFEFPEELNAPGRDAGVKSKMDRLASTMKEDGFILPACNIPDIDARLDRVVAKAMASRDREGPSVGDGSASHDDNDNDLMVGCHGAWAQYGRIKGAKIIALFSLMSWLDLSPLASTHAGGAQHSQAHPLQLAGAADCWAADIGRPQAPHA